MHTDFSRQYLTRLPAFILVTLSVLMPGLTLAEPSSTDLVRCGVYQFMTVGAMRRSGGLDALVEGEFEKMNRFVAMAKQAGESEQGDAWGEQQFNDEWQAALAEMTDQINRNYQNISVLKYQYRERCNGYL